MAQFDLGPLYEQIGVLMARDLGLNPEGAYLYAQAGEGWAEASIFEASGAQIVHRDPSQELFALIMDVWERTEPAKRWATMAYTISDGSFAAEFTFLDQLDLSETSVDRLKRKLLERFGDKPVDHSDPEPRA